MSKVTSIVLLFPLLVQTCIFRGMTDTCGDTWNAANNATALEADAERPGGSRDKSTLTASKQQEMAVGPLGRNHWNFTA